MKLKLQLFDTLKRLPKFTVFTRNKGFFTLMNDDDVPVIRDKINFLFTQCKQKIVSNQFLQYLA